MIKIIHTGDLHIGTFGLRVKILMKCREKIDDLKFGKLLKE